MGFIDIDKSKLHKVESVEDLEQNKFYLIDNIRENSKKKFIVIAECILIEEKDDGIFHRAEFNDIYSIRNDWEEGLLNWDIDETDFEKIYDVYYITKDDYPEYYI